MTGSHTSSSSVTCPTCFAEPGRPCVSVRDRVRMSYFHSARVDAQRAADEVMAPAPNESPIFLGADTVRLEMSVDTPGTDPQRWGVRYAVPHQRDEFTEALWARQLGEEVRKIALQELSRLRRERG